MSKPLGKKLYGSIPHLSGSRLGPADHHISPGQEKICTVKSRPGDRIIVQEKLDGSNCGAAVINGDLVPLTRRGYHARSSPFAQHHIFADWVELNRSRFLSVIGEGERIVGEWLLQAHGTKYDLKHEPFAVFDIFSKDDKRLNIDELISRLEIAEFVSPTILSVGPPVPVDKALELLGPHGHHGAIDPAEGVVYRVEHNGRVEFLAKYVRPDKVDGIYLPERSGGEPIYNISPKSLGICKK